ncbi:Gfo/Idh/MocA family oxidoreductase [Sedimentimonas flavescens]|uniref:Gfo/Idh/MocA family oxidoreductase n=1 Tax=Sedimentimonas flavescens TaxID=2851012 RepID=A0ABT3A0E7_9RHOB|nr:Gfo/Idh/MocA family oxidoreductase [Sedimentimonas flavescens]MCV2879483.1 Gfo/Idh/MocA family oxidoreductase [Sedimentimonas flavescens]
MKPINWGILGASNFALKHMGPAIHAASGARLGALATSSPEKAAPFCAFCPDLRVHDSYDALLADPEIEAVYIPLPNTLHIEWSLKALAAGKHVLCEKPIAMRAEEIGPLIAARDAAGLFATEAYMIVHHPQWEQVREWLDEGQIGELRHADVVFSFNNPDPANIRNRAETGGGSIPDIGVYAYSSVRYAARAEPGALRALIRRENGVDVFAQVTGEMIGPQGGFSYSAITSTRLHPRQEVTFQGDRGLIRVHVPFNAGVAGEAALTLQRTGEPDRVLRYPGINQYVLQVENFARHIREGAPYPWTLEDARAGQAMIDKVRASEA